MNKGFLKALFSKVTGHQTALKLSFKKEEKRREQEKEFLNQKYFINSKTQDVNNPFYNRIVPAKENGVC